MGRIFAFLFALVLLAAACGGGSGDNSPPSSPTDTAQRFLSLWKDHRYDEMYNLISLEAQGTIDHDKFVQRYSAIADEATLEAIDFELKPDTTASVSPIETDAIAIPFAVTFHTRFFGDFAETNTVPVVRDLITPSPAGDSQPESHKEWRVDWKPAVIFKELDARSLVHFFTQVPRRGTIYDRNNKPMALDASLPVVGIVPDRLTDKEAVIGQLSQMLGLPEDEVRAKVNTTLPSYYFIPIKTLPYNSPPEVQQKFREMVDLGVLVKDTTQRLYPYGSAAAHVLGYMTEVTEDQLKDLAAQGFQSGDKIGAAGLEGQMNDVLSGTRGGMLATVTPEGSIAKTIAEKPAVGGKDVHLAVDIEVQKKAEAELGDRVGSVVVMDPRDNSVLALASSPRFDPNAFIQGLTAEQFNSLSNDPKEPFLNRPLLATYPPGSTFKTVTASAGLEKGGYTPDSTFHCSPVWTGLGEKFAKNNWQNVDRGYLTASEGLMASCNPVFYEIAKTLDETDENILPQFAKAFGYGSITGVGMEEAPGIVPDAKWKQDNIGEDWFTGDAVNMGIGQGFMLVTPIQIANAYSALALTGILRKPLLIKSISDQTGTVAQEFKADPINALPISQGTLDAIRYGLKLVVQSPSGTAYQSWVGSSVDAAGKSGTAEDLSFGSDHTWFVAYADRTNPSVLALASLELGEHGQAAPIVRHILEAYLGGALTAPAP